jgi:hypothetical protein
MKYLSRSSTADANDVVEPGKKKFFKRLRMLELVLRLPGTSKGPALLLERLLFKYLQEGKEDGRVVEYCFPSDKTLTNDTKMKEHELKRCMAHLRKVGLIDWRWIGSKRFIDFNWSLLEKKTVEVSEVEEEQGPKEIEERPEEVECPHCKKTGSTNAMRRWRFDRCRRKPVPLPKIAASRAETNVAIKSAEPIEPRLEDLVDRLSDDAKQFASLALGKSAVNADLERSRRIAEDLETTRRLEEEQKAEAMRMLEEVQRTSGWVQ